MFLAVVTPISAQLTITRYLPINYIYVNRYVFDNNHFLTLFEHEIVSYRLHSHPLRYLTIENWIPTFWSPIFNITNFQQSGMIRTIRAIRALLQFMA